MTRKRPLMLGEYLFQKLGYRNGTKVAAFIVAWGIYADSLPVDDVWTIEGYARYWGESDSTAYRELRLFREAFAEDSYPFRVWALIRDDVDARKSRRSVAIAQALSISGGWSS